MHVPHTCVHLPYLCMSPIFMHIPLTCVCLLYLCMSPILVYVPYIYAYPSYLCMSPIFMHIPHTCVFLSPDCTKVITLSNTISSTQQADVPVRLYTPAAKPDTYRGFPQVFQTKFRTAPRPDQTTALSPSLPFTCCFNFVCTTVGPTDKNMTNDTKCHCRRGKEEANVMNPISAL